VLLITSRESGRWIIPKGNIAAGSTAAQAAATEAYEEAGVRGRIVGVAPLGLYTYLKRLPSGERRAAAVEVYPLRVDKQLANWPEKGERRLMWLAPAAAARRVEEPGVVPLLAKLMELEQDHTAFDPTVPPGMHATDPA
jgi:uncharacterized protein